MSVKPTPSEELFLSLGYNRFYDLFDEILDDEFWSNDGWYRFSKVSNIFGIYTELLSYEPLRTVIEEMRSKRPPMEAEIGGALFKFVRNLLAHFPIFESWNEIWINQTLVNWDREGLTIDRFLKKYAGHNEVKYRFWQEEKKKMIYLSIRFPSEYSDQKIYLKDMISEKDGVTFCLIMMRQILNTQVLSV